MVKLPNESTYYIRAAFKTFPGPAVGSLKERVRRLSPNRCAAHPFAYGALSP